MAAGFFMDITPGLRSSATSQANNTAAPQAGGLTLFRCLDSANQGLTPSPRPEANRSTASLSQPAKTRRQFSPQRGLAATKTTKAIKAVFLTEAPRHGARQKGMDSRMRGNDGKGAHHGEQINAGCRATAQRKHEALLA